MPPAKDPYAEVTESPGSQATSEQVSMLYTRYHTAASYCAGMKVLEVACGTGMGLGYMASQASLVVGGDYSPSLIRTAQQHYNGRIPLVRLDAHALPFQGGSFDVVILYEAVYYLAQPDRFLAESQRVLHPGGTLLICTANKDRSGFVRSRHSHQYFSADQLRRLLEKHGFSVNLFGAFPTAEATLKGSLLAQARRIAASLNLIPGTLKGRELLKRLAYGSLEELPSEVREEMAPLEPLVSIPGEAQVEEFKVLYAVASLP